MKVHYSDVSAIQMFAIQIPTAFAMVIQSTLMVIFQMANAPKSEIVLLCFHFLRLPLSYKKAKSFWY